MTILRNIQLQGQHRRPILTDVFYMPSEKALPVVIFAHGFKGFKDWGNFDLVAQQFAAAGFVFVKFNFSHNGTTPQNPTEFTDLPAFGQNNHCIELDDLGSVIDFVSDTLPLLMAPQPVDVRQINLIGHSRGGGIAIIKAAEDLRISRLIAWASVHQFGGWQIGNMDEWRDKGVLYIPNTRTGQAMPLYYQLWETFVANQDRLDVQHAARSLRIPFLIIHGQKDATVPYQAAEILHQHCPHSQLLLLPTADHVFGATHPWHHNTLPADAVPLVEATLDFCRG